jgi:hypothetical protein
MELRVLKEIRATRVFKVKLEQLELRSYWSYRS